MSTQQTLPKELTSMVHWSVSQLGEVLQDQLGTKTFRIIEEMRQLTKSYQTASESRICELILELEKQITRYPSATQHNISHAFGLMLELINACEAAYRSFRLKSYPSTASQKSNTERITYVLTAHPTEAKSIELIELFDKIQSVLIESLIEGQSSCRDQLKFWLTMAWHIPLAKHKKPRIVDEANAIFSIALKPKILERWVQLFQTGTPIYLRTWVGGDKDGHPGVDEVALKASLNSSRKHLVNYMQLCCDKSLSALSQIPSDYVSLTLSNQIKGLKSSLQKLKTLQKNDGTQCSKFAQQIERVTKVYRQEMGVECYYLKQVRTLLEMTPAIVIPLELREDSSVVAEAIKKPKDYAIGRMLKTLQEVSGKSPTEWYAKGFILSMTETTQDMLNGVELVRKTIPQQDIPVVPLFENEIALLNGPQILEDFVKNSSVPALIRTKWENCIEVMVGYSDSSKENGALRSRQLIESALYKIEKVILNLGYEARFFHGSGGSVARGGGSIEDQTSWWPKSAQRRFKATIQGEMIGRSFASPEVFSRQASKIMNQSIGKKDSTSKELRKIVEIFAEKTRDQYQEMVGNEEFMAVVAESTPYNYLQFLKIGSRPSKRKSELSLESLRAIPWILCWTQTRVLFPTWWGLGTAWSSLESNQQTQLKKAYQQIPVFRSYINLCGFTLAKATLGVWKAYLQNTEMTEEKKKQIFDEVYEEYKKATQCIRDISGSQDLLWYRPWLGLSIALRNPLIHPLNALQIVALKNKDHTLLRETVTGIASGMMTTG